MCCSSLYCCRWTDYEISRPSFVMGTRISQVDKLFLKVIKNMAAERHRFPCTASLINDRMKKE